MYRVFGLSLVAVTLSTSILSPSTLPAQIVASERAMVAQTVDGTRLTVDYSRPRARGRTNIYGGMERWGTTWTPGADDATTLEVSKPVEVLGLRVPAGRYSMWFVLREHEPWTFVLDPRDTLFHTDHPDSTAQQLRAPVRPYDTPHTEALTFDFPDVTTTGATLRFRWGTRGVDLPITVPPTLPLTISAEEAAPFLGEYDFVWTDTSDAPAPSRFTVVRRGDQLFGVWDPPPYGSLREMQLLMNGPDRFAYGWFRDGALWATNPELNLMFERVDGQVRSFTYGTADEVFARGRRR
jgi:hypothetical protein